LYGVVWVIMRRAVLACVGQTDGPTDGEMDTRWQHVLW